MDRTLLCFSLQSWLYKIAASLQQLYYRNSSRGCIDCKNGLYSSSAGHNMHLDHVQQGAIASISSICAKDLAPRIVNTHNDNCILRAKRW